MAFGHFFDTLQPGQSARFHNTVLPDRSKTETGENRRLRARPCKARLPRPAGCRRGAEKRPDRKEKEERPKDATTVRAFFSYWVGLLHLFCFSDILYLLSVDKGTQDFRGHISGHGCVKPLVIRPHFFRSFSLPRHARYLLKTRGAECNSVRAVQGRTAQECRRQCKRRAHRNGPNQLLYPKRMRREALLR